MYLSKNIHIKLADKIGKFPIFMISEILKIYTGLVSKFY